MLYLLDNSILSSFQKFKHSLKASAFMFKKSNVIVVPVQSLIMFVQFILSEMHLGISGKGKGIAKVMG